MSRKPQPRSKYGYTIAANLLLIADCGGVDDVSVTNDIENVLADLAAHDVDVDAYHVFYRDSTGMWDAIETEHRRFKEFVILQKADVVEAIKAYRSK